MNYKPCSNLLVVHIRNIRQREMKASETVRGRVYHQSFSFELGKPKKQPPEKALTVIILKNDILKYTRWQDKQLEATLCLYCLGAI